MQRTLANAGILVVGQLRRAKDDELKRIPNFGALSVSRVRAAVPCEPGPPSVPQRMAEAVEVIEELRHKIERLHHDAQQQSALFDKISAGFAHRLAILEGHAVTQGKNIPGYIFQNSVGWKKPHGD